MSLRKKLELNWKGKSYPLLVTMEVIDSVDDTISAATLLARMAKGDIRYAHIAKFLAAVLREAGCDVSQEDVYNEIFLGGESSITDAQEMVGLIASAFFPEQKKKDASKTAVKKSRA